MSGFLEENFTPHAQFEVLTVCVWLSALILAIVIVRSPQHLRNYGLWCLPIFQLFPWYAGLSERRKLIRAAPPDGKNDIPAVQSLTRLLWAAYAVLGVVELLWFFP